MENINAVQTSRIEYVLIDGGKEQVRNTLSSGPGAPVTTYELVGGRYVYSVGREWKLQEPGKSERTVRLSIPAKADDCGELSEADHLMGDDPVLG